jgi:hypothetical protein
LNAGLGQAYGRAWCLLGQFADPWLAPIGGGGGGYLPAALRAAAGQIGRRLVDVRRSDLIAQLHSRKESLLALGVGELYLFGSVARDEAGEDSDVDLLVEFTGPPSFDRFMDLKFFLEDALGCPVDLVTRRALKTKLRFEIERDAVRVT